MHKAQLPSSSDWNTFAESFSFTPPVHNSNGPLWYLSDADQFIGNRQCRSFETYQKSVTHQVWNLHFIVLSLILFSVCFCFDRFYCGINFLWQGVAGKDNRGQDPASYGLSNNFQPFWCRKDQLKSSCQDPAHFPRRLDVVRPPVLPDIWQLTTSSVLAYHPCVMQSIISEPHL